MDEIQDCIADAQFGEVLRGRENTRPNARITSPPDDFVPAEFGRQRKVDLEYAVGVPVGVYILSKEFPENKHVYNFLGALKDFKKVETPGMENYMLVLNRASKLPSKYRAEVDEVSSRLTASVLPQLTSTPSMGRLLMGGGPASPDEPVKELDLGDSVDEQVVHADDVDVEAGEEELARKRLSLTRHRTENKALAVDIFDDLRATLMADQKEYWVRFQTTESFARLMSVLWYCEQPVTLDQFNIFRDLGRGAFGVVSGAKFKATGALLALKCMNKKLVKGKNALKLVKAEREVLAKLGERPSHFTVYLQYSFTDKDTFYLALPLCSGGDLQYHLAVEHYFEPERARFHIAEVVLGLAHLHNLGILYRDLKPDNILLDEEGHCRISDMGLAIVTNGKHLRGRAGTPGYWAPEMLQKKRYSYPVDWWSLGCVLYELLAARCPFSKLNTKMERDDATLHWQLVFPTRLGSGMGGEQRPFPKDAEAFIRRLLVRDKTKRLGASELGAEEVKDDPYFASIDWGRLARKELTPPWRPAATSIHAFAQSDIDGKSNEHDYRKLKLTPTDEIPNFDFTSTLKHQEDVVDVLKLQDDGALAHLDRPDQIGCCSLM